MRMGIRVRGSAGCRRRRWLGVAVALALLVGADALAQDVVPGSHKGTCRRISRQIDQFEDTLLRARERDNELWAEGTLKHLERLYARRGTLCPEYAMTRAAARRAQGMAAAADFVKTAGQAALRFFTFGAY